MAFAVARAKAVGEMADGHDQSNSEGGLRAYFSEFAVSLRRLLAARLGNPSDAEDLLQDMWIKLADIPSGPIANPKAYLHKMALNLANDLVRSRVRQRGREAAWSDVMVAGADTVAIDPTPSPERALSDKMELDVLVRAIQSLPERARQVFRMHRLEGASHAEVAAALGISKSAVEKNMATAMKNLARAMNVSDGT